MKNLILALFAILFLPLSFSIASAAPAVAAPNISQLQGMVVIRGKTGFQHAYHGMQLKKGDEIRTGRSGRAYIDFPDNSRVKLGSRARFVVQDWQQDDGVFSSALKIFQGAFRYTAKAIGNGLRKRNTTVTTRTAVLGVRGTDFWGRVKNDETFFLLIEGEVSLSPRFGQTITYNHAGAAVQITATEISAPKELSSESIAPLAAETEIAESTL